MPRLLYVIPEISFACQHAGLMRQMKDRKIDPAKLRPGDVVGFLNRSETMFRVWAVLPEKDSFGLVASYRSPHGRVKVEVVKNMISQALGGNGFQMDAKLKVGLERLLGTRRLEIIRAEGAA